MEIFDPYNTTILIIGLVGIMSLIQLAVADVSGIRNKHTPGHVVTPDHSDFLFRAVRAHANTNESVSIFILLSLFGMFSNADPSYLNIFSIVYFVGRITHMSFYYFNFKAARSIAFGLSFIGLMGMSVIGLISWF